MPILRRSLALVAAVGAFLALGLAVGSYARGRGEQVTVFQERECGCCEAWIDHMEQAGFSVEVRIVARSQLDFIRAEVGLRPAHYACHTSIIGGYLFEGHVPAEAVAKVLRTRPAIAGLAVPGMPVGSPGMEGAGMPEGYDVLAFTSDGSTSVFMQKQVD